MLNLVSVTILVGLLALRSVVSELSCVTACIVIILGLT